MNVLEQIMGTKEASQRWGLPVDEIIRMCREGRLQAVRLEQEDVWVLAKDQPHPLAGQAPERLQAKPGKDKTAYMSTKLLDALYE